MRVFDVKELRYVQKVDGEAVKRVWHLGIGSCGKDAVQLKVGVGQWYLHILQVTGCGEERIFYVPMNQIVSTIQITVNESEAVNA